MNGINSRPDPSNRTLLLAAAGIVIAVCAFVWFIGTARQFLGI